MIKIIKRSLIASTFIIAFIFIMWSESTQNDFVIINENGGKKVVATKKVRTTSDVEKEIGSKVKAALAPTFYKCGLSYPPQQIALLFFKQEKKMELWAKNDADWTHVKQYPILAASGNSGPKLKEGDQQVPEGIYKMEYLNPNSNYHLSMKINYPNSFDLAQAKIENRNDLGGNIFIHGKAVSIGCLAMGDDAAEQLFILAYLVGVKNIQVIIAPKDSRPNSIEISQKPNPTWLPLLYNNISKELKCFKSK